MDNICIVAPDNLREFLFALGCCQEYQIQTIVGSEQVPPKRDSNFLTTFKMDEKFSYFAPCLVNIKSTHVPIIDTSGWYEPARSEYSCYFEFDTEKALAYARRRKQHITVGYGIMSGIFLNALAYNTVSMKTPILGPLFIDKKVDISRDALIIRWDKESDKLYEMIVTSYPELVIDIVDECTTDPKELIETIVKYRIVIGKASCATYIAGSMDKGVVELFDIEDDYFLYNSMALGPYVSCKNNPPANYLWALWEQIWQKVSEHISVTNSQEDHLTIQEESIAVVADEKLVDTQDVQ